MTLNSQLSESEAIDQLNIARDTITNLQLFIEQVEKEFKLYKKYEKHREHKVSANVDFLYYQLKFMRKGGDKFAHIIIQDDKIVRIEAFLPPE